MKESFFMPGYVIEKFEYIVNVMGEIHGIDLTEVIGAAYKLFPFPQSPEEFKQKLDGKAHRAVVENLISQWSQPRKILVEVEAGSQRVKIAELLFSKATFRELVAYVWRGGMPGWEDTLRPDYVRNMKDAIDISVSPLFTNFKL